MATVPGIVLILGTMAAATAAAIVGSTGRAGYGPLKLLAASGYVALALSLGAVHTSYGRVLLAALLLCWLGDLLLVGTSRRAVLAGLAAFLLAHLAYAGAFLIHGVHLGPAVPAALAMAALATAVLRWLRGASLPTGMRAPVVAYLAALGLMVTLAAGTGRALVLLGAASFAASDLFVARQRFVSPDPLNRRLGLPLYFAAQLLLASSV
jgi:uncharacterized membrane protein YhhN